MENVRKYTTGWVDHDDIYLLYRNGDVKEKEVITDFRWYFYVLKNDHTRKILQKAIRLGFIKKNKLKVGKKFVRIYYKWSVRFDFISFLKENDVVTYESDLSPLDLYVLHHNVQIENKYRILYIDIETDDRKSGIIPGRDRILSFAYYDNLGNSDCILEEDERKLCRKVIKLFDKYDVICGWNSRSFDYVVLKKRFEILGIVYDFREIIHYDMMWRMIKLGAYGIYLPNYALDTVGKYFFGVGKVEIEGGNAKIYNLYLNNRERLKEYNLRDAQLLKMIDDKVKMLNLSILECVWCSTFLNQFYISKLLDNYILKRAHKKGLIYPARFTNYDKKKTKFAGGYVFDVKPGVHSNVFMFDYKSLYPNIIKSFNISLDVLANKDDKDIITTPNGVHYKRDEEGLVCALISKLMENRKQYKAEMLKHHFGSVEYEIYNLMQDVVKEMANSMYGILGSAENRYFNIKIAESITLTGQWCIKTAAKYFEEKGHVIVAGDTDSIFVKVKKGKFDAIKEAEKFNEYLKKKCLKEYNCKEFTVKLEYKKTYEKLITVSKKRYAGYLVDNQGNKEDYVDVVGLECKKANSVGYAKDMMKHIIDQILKTNEGLDFYVNYIKDKKEEIMNKDNYIQPSQLIKYIKIGKDPSEYKSDLVHVRLAKQIKKENRGFYLGMTLQYIITKSKPKLDGILVGDYTGEFDRIHYWNREIYPMSQRILELAYPNYDWAQYLIEVKKKRKSRKKKKGDK